MTSPVPKHLRTNEETRSIPASLSEHVNDLVLNGGSKQPKSTVKGLGSHRAKFAPGLSHILLDIAGSDYVGDPMAGTGTLARETGMPMALNDIDTGMARFLSSLPACEVTYTPACQVAWQRRVDVCVFSPPYYPRTDRRRPNAHDDSKRGPVVGFRDSYECEHALMIGNPCGVDGISIYRQQMSAVYRHLIDVCTRMVIVTKNWMRLGTELRLDLDTILMCQEAGWRCVERHGFTPPSSLWARYNKQRGAKQGRSGIVEVEDILVFERASLT